MELVGWPEPQPITDAQKTGERFLVWHRIVRRWIDCCWVDRTKSGHPVFAAVGGGYWHHEYDGCARGIGADLVTHCIPLPPDVKP